MKENRVTSSGSVLNKLVKYASSPDHLGCLNRGLCRWCFFALRAESRQLTPEEHRLPFRGLQRAKAGHHRLER